MKKSTFCFCILFFVFYSNGCTVPKIKEIKKRIVKVVPDNGIGGGGFIVKTDNNHIYILTLCHVLGRDQKPKVLFFLNDGEKGKESSSEVINKICDKDDEERPKNCYEDFAILKVEYSKELKDRLPIIFIRSKNLDDLHNQLEGKKDIFTIGFPIQPQIAWAIEALTYSGIEERTNLSFSGAISEGHSGGPVIVNEEVIGTVCKVINHNKAYVIPAPKLKEYVEKILFSPSSESETSQKLKMIEIPGRDFEICKHEITVEEYEAFCKATNRSEHPCGKNEGQKDMPVTNVSWKDANDYANWLNSLPEQESYCYRLPTSEEWEYAARGGKDTPYFWGDRPEDACEYANVGDRTFAQQYPDKSAKEIMIECDDGYIEASSVCSFNHNEFGLCDMIGNVSEWIADCDEQYKTENGECRRHIVRGGSWHRGAKATLLNSTGSYPSQHKSSEIGFRLIRDKKK